MTTLISAGSNRLGRDMARRAASVQLPRGLVADLLESSIRLQEVAETLEVQLDRRTVRRLKIGERQYKRGAYRVASSRTDIDRLLTS